MKQAGTVDPFLPVVDKAGNIKHLFYSQNAGHTFVELFHGRGIVSARGREQGFTALEDLYKEDPNPVVAEQGYGYYLKWNHACRTQTAETEFVEGAVPGSKKERPKPFPDKWLPAEVLKRRDGSSKVSPKGWAPPEFPDPEPVKAKPKKAKKTDGNDGHAARPG